VAPGRVVLSTAEASIADVVAIADGAEVVVDDEARWSMARSRQVVQDAVDRGEPIYGVTTGVGDARDINLSPDQIQQAQAALVRMHAGALGPPLGRRVVRAAMAARLIGLCRGGSGASPAVADMLAALLNNAITPVVPATSSVGAGDLGAHALIGLVAIGEGQADVGGVVVPGADALSGAGLRPLTLHLKDAIALISANGLTLGRGALVLDRAVTVLKVADHVAATSFDAVRANPSVLDPLVQEAKGIPGQSAVAARMRSHLACSQRTADPASLQDALSFRVTPQVNGAATEILTAAEGALVRELNAQADNPLAAAGTNRVISNGNFHPILVAIAFESLRVALAHVAHLSDRRAGIIWDTMVGAVSGSAPLASHASPAALNGLLLRYASAARSTAAHRLAHPVTLDVPVLDRGHEDHATNAPAAVDATDNLLDVLLDLLATEALIAAALIDARPEPPAGQASRELLTRLDAVMTGDAPPPAHEAHTQARDAVLGCWTGVGAPSADHSPQ
jgi:histidine ammonia-lyase